jgi:hypothetical protein
MHRSSIRAAGFVVALVGAACGDDGPPIAPDASALDAFQPPWWTPHPGQTKNYDIQLAAPFDVSAPRVMYELDLWDVASATTIDYGDADPVTVPAGPLAGKVTELHARVPRPIVICHIDTGAIALDDPDARKFPGFEATPPDRPTVPKAGSVIGWTTFDPNKRFLDIRATKTSLWAAVMVKRFELADMLGCDAIDGDYNDQIGQDTGFDAAPPAKGPSGDDVTAWFTRVATEAHMREISAGQRNANLLTPGLVDLFDWMLIERCGEFDDCDTTRPYIDQNKTVFAVDYLPDVNGGVDLAIACSRYPHALIEEGLHKDAALTSAYRMECP